MQHADAYGLSAKEVKFDLGKIVARSRGVSEQMKKGIGFLMKKHKVTVHEGFGALGLPPPEKKGDKGSELAGPAVAGLDRNAFSQDDADDLLSGLGL